MKKSYSKSNDDPNSSVVSTEALSLTALVGLPLGKGGDLSAKSSRYLDLPDNITFSNIKPSIRIEHRSKFRQLADEWYRDRPRGDIRAMCMHRAYLRIVGMGPIAVPFILEELQRKPEHWFVALALLTDRDDVVPAESRGRIRDMADAWIKWGMANGRLAV